MSQALRDVVSSPRLPGVLLAGTVISLLPFAGIDAAGRKNTLGIVLAVLAAVVVYGYQLSYAHRVSRESERFLPSLASAAHLRRGVVGLLAAEMPLLLFAVASFALDWLASALVDWWNLSFWPLDLLAAASILAFLSVPLLEIVVGARYAYHDRWVEAVRYAAALREGWQHKAAVAIPLVLEVGWTVISLSVRYALGRVWASRLLLGFSPALVALMAGRATGAQIGLVCVMALLTGLDVAVQLVVANLLGQYAFAVFGAPATDELGVPA